MGAEPIRCDAPHPDDPARRCNARLFDAWRDVVTRGAAGSRECITIRCHRCGTRHSVYIRAA